MSGVCFVDCETTGLDPDRHEVWEVGLIVPIVIADEDDEEDEWEEHVWQLPVDLGKADQIALNIGRFHDRRTTETMLPEFVRLTRGLHLVGACVSFDADRLWRLIRKAGECPMWHYHLIDVEALAAGWLLGAASTDEGLREVARPPWKSTDLSQAVGVDPDGFDRHTALGDARWAKAIYEAVMGKGGR